MNKECCYTCNSYNVDNSFCEFINCKTEANNFACGVYEFDKDLFIDTIIKDMRNTLSKYQECENTKENREKILKETLECVCDEAIKFKVVETEKDKFEVTPYTETYAFTITLKS